ncbi:MAG: hypothetical protein ACRD1K_04935 [Acidimicrobiales bacterium]
MALADHLGGAGHRPHPQAAGDAMGEATGVARTRTLIAPRAAAEANPQ